MFPSLRHLAAPLVLVLAFAAAAASADVQWSVGDDVMALGKDGGWYYAQVLEVNGNLYRVDMLGLSKEWVDASRLRPRTAEEIRALVPVEDPAPAAAPSKPGDERVATALRSIGLAASTDSDGDYKLELPTKGGRTQLVWVISQTQEWGELEIREVWSPAFKTEGKLDLAMARKLLSENNAKKLGAWRIVGTGEKEVAIFAVHVDASATGDVLKDVIDLVKSVADSMESEVVGTDDL